jgi:hypothetical protein
MEEAMRKRATLPLSKYAVWVVIISAHVLLIEVLSREGKSQARATSADEPKTILYFLDPPLPIKRPAASKPVPLRPRFSRPRDAPTPNNAITLPEASPDAQPPIDWETEAARAVQDAVARQMAKESLRSLARPQEGMGPPPPKSARHKLGDSERLEGGEVIDWVDDRCYYSNQPPPGPTMGPGRLQLKICRPGGGPNWYQDFETWKKSKSELKSETRQDRSERDSARY